MDVGNILNIDRLTRMDHKFFICRNLAEICNSELLIIEFPHHHRHIIGLHFWTAVRRTHLHFEGNLVDGFLAGVSNRIRASVENATCVDMRLQSTSGLYGNLRWNLIDLIYGHFLNNGIKVSLYFFFSCDPWIFLNKNLNRNLVYLRSFWFWFWLKIERVYLQICFIFVLMFIRSLVTHEIFPSIALRSLNLLVSLLGKF